MKLFSEETLSHYGIPNQKWGQRRWQNEDGTFNEAGKERYFGKKGDENIEKEKQKYHDLYDLNEFAKEAQKVNDHNRPIINDFINNTTGFDKVRNNLALKFLGFSDKINDTVIKVTDKKMNNIRNTFENMQKQIKDDFYEKYPYEKSLDLMNLGKTEIRRKLDNELDTKYNIDYRNGRNY